MHPIARKLFLHKEFSNLLQAFHPVKIDATVVTVASISAAIFTVYGLHTPTLVKKVTKLAMPTRGGPPPARAEYTAPS